MLESNLTGYTSVSVIIATYNEENAIRKKLETLLSVVPRGFYEIIVVDSGSIDDTRKIVSEYANKGVILLAQEKRLGKANALNLALKKAKGEIIVLSDANSEFSPDSINALVEKFDSETGAVLPRFMPSGKMNLWDRIFYWLHNSYKSLESKADSVFVVFGELFAFRKDLINSTKGEIRPELCYIYKGIIEINNFLGESNRNKIFIRKIILCNRLRMKQIYIPPQLILKRHFGLIKGAFQK